MDKVLHFPVQITLVNIYSSIIASHMCTIYQFINIPGFSANDSDMFSINIIIEKGQKENGEIHLSMSTTILVDQYMS